MSLYWSDDLAVGNELIDTQHRELFSRFHDFIAACDERRGPDEVARVFSFLDDYVKAHFAAEEGLMQQCGYPRYAEHREEHRRFVERIAGLQGELQHSGATVKVLVLTSKALVFWLTEHIRHVDTQFAAFVREGRSDA